MDRSELPAWYKQITIGTLATMAESQFRAAPLPKLCKALAFKELRTLLSRGGSPDRLKAAGLYH